MQESARPRSAVQEFGVLGWWAAGACIKVIFAKYTYHCIASHFMLQDAPRFPLPQPSLDGGLGKAGPRELSSVLNFLGGWRTPAGLKGGKGGGGHTCYKTLILLSQISTLLSSPSITQLPNAAGHYIHYSYLIASVY